VAVIGVEGVEIRIYKAEELVTTLTTDPKGRADTMLEADTYRVEYWFKERKIGEHEITLEVDSFTVWSFPAILMAIVRKLPLAVEVEGKLGDVVLTLPLTIKVEAKTIPEFYPSLNLSIQAKLTDVKLTPSLTLIAEAKLVDVALTQSLVETVSVA